MRNATTPESPFVVLLRAWPDARAIADDLQIPYFTVAAWFRRENVAAAHWEALVAAARERGLRRVTYNRFRLAAAERQHRLSSIRTARSAAQDAPAKNPSTLDSTMTRKQSHAV